MSRFIFFFSPSLVVFNFLVLAMFSEQRERALIGLAITLAATVPWYVISRFVTRALRARTARALDALTNNMAMAGDNP